MVTRALPMLVAVLALAAPIGGSPAVAAASAPTLSAGSNVASSAPPRQPGAGRVGSNLSTPRFCTCSRCADLRRRHKRHSLPSGCLASGESKAGLPDFARNVNIESTALLRKYRSCSKDAVTPRSCDDLHNGEMQRCGAISLGWDEGIKKFDDDSLGGFVRWDAAHGYWTPTLANGGNYTSDGQLCNSMCPNAAAEALKWAEGVAAEAVASGKTVVPQHDLDCLCGAVAWFAEGPGALHHNASGGASWVTGLPPGVEPFISYPEDDCYCPPVDQDLTTTIPPPKTVRVHFTMEPAPSLDVFEHSFPQGCISQCLTGVISGRSNQWQNRFFKEHHLTKEQEFLVVQALGYALSHIDCGGIKPHVTAAARAASAALGAVMGVGGEAVATAAAWDATPAPPDDGRPRGLVGVGAGATTGDDDDPPDQYCAGCKVKCVRPTSR